MKIVIRIFVVCILLALISGCEKSTKKPETTIDTHTQIESESEVSMTDEISVNTESTELSRTADNFKKSICEDEMEKALKVAKDYYGNETVWQLDTIETSKNDILYNNQRIESDYDFGKIIIFDVVAHKGDESGQRTISVVKNANGDWEVINEGF